MWSRLSIVLGLLAGMATAALVLGGILAFAPEPAPIVTPSPSPSVAVPSPTPSASASPTVTPAASASPEASTGASPVASASGGPSASAEASDGTGEALGVGVVRDAAFGGIGADIMAQGPQTIMPDVTVTP